MAHVHDHRGDARGDVKLITAVAVNLALTVAQIVGGIVAGSLALVADALHNLNDAMSLLLALVARRIGRYPPDAVRTFGYRRAETVAAMINLTALVVVGLFLGYEAILRFVEPTEVGGWIVIIIATVALAVDVVTALLTYSMSKGSINVRAAFIHNLADALASVGVILAGVLVLLFGWNVADPIIALIIAGYIIYQGIASMRPAVRVLIDSAPEGLEVDRVVQAMESVSGVRSVHHIHVRMLDEHHPSMTAHVIVEAARLPEMPTIKQTLKQRLEEAFNITHVTLEFETEAEAAAEDHPVTVIPPPHGM